MARKNLLAGISERKPPPPAEPASTLINAPGRTLPLAFAGKGALGAVTRTIDELAARAGTAKDLEARLTAGNVVVDLDPASVDRSFVADRMDGPDDSYVALLEAIRQHGQDSPILVRPNPTSPGRYQVAFGHRRLRIAAELGRPVKAVVKLLSDRDLVIAQGQENSARTDLSFIERVRFARQLQELGHDRETIMLALSVDKTVVSRMISVAAAIPGVLIDAIGPAPGIGRDRWLDLVAVFQAAGEQREVGELVRSPDFRDRSSDDRFEWVRASLAAIKDPAAPGNVAPRKSRKGAQATYWSSRDGKKLARISANERAFTLTIDSRLAPDFGEYLLQELDRLYEAYSKRTGG
jgi:ParB family chromosome partitioning protein